MEEEDQRNLKKKRKRCNGTINNRKPVRLRCSVQNYDWGVVGDDSHVSRLFFLNSGLRSVDRGKPFAEFWIGTHESGPSYVFAAVLMVAGSVPRGLVLRIEFLRIQLFCLVKGSLRNGESIFLFCSRHIGFLR